jgi:putative iron-only hydrogenase system regulator
MAPEQMRIANIGILIQDRAMADKINDILSRHGDVIRGRLGIPFRDEGVSVISVIIEADTDRIGSINGSLGNVPGVKVRSAMLR